MTWVEEETEPILGILAASHYPVETTEHQCIWTTGSYYFCLTVAIVAQLQMKTLGTGKIILRTLIQSFGGNLEGCMVG